MGTYSWLIFVNKTLLEHSHAQLFTDALWLFFMLPWQSWIVATESM